MFYVVHLAIVGILLCIGFFALYRYLRAPKHQSSEILSKQQKQIVELIAEGKADKEIAAILGVSSHTIKTHIANIYVKLGAINRANCVYIACKRQLL